MTVADVSTGYISSATFNLPNGGTIEMDTDGECKVVGNYSPNKDGICSNRLSPAS